MYDEALRSLLLLIRGVRQVERPTYSLTLNEGSVEGKWEMHEVRP
jgi:hypothetical protein